MKPTQELVKAIRSAIDLIQSKEFDWKQSVCSRCTCTAVIVSLLSVDRNELMKKYTYRGYWHDAALVYNGQEIQSSAFAHYFELPVVLGEVKSLFSQLYLKGLESADDFELLEFAGLGRSSYITFRDAIYLHLDDDCVSLKVQNVRASEMKLHINNLTELANKLEQELSE